MKIKNSNEVIEREQQVLDEINSALKLIDKIRE